MNLLHESDDSVPFFTNVQTVWLAMGISAADFDWYVSDVETNTGVPGLPTSGGWLTGQALNAMLAGVDVQFIWGVFSAFPPGTRHEVLKAPRAERGSEFWTGSGVLEPELAGALFELICWDSSATILVGITAEQANRFTQTYPEAKPFRVGTNSA